MKHANIKKNVCGGLTRPAEVFLSFHEGSVIRNPDRHANPARLRCSSIRIRSSVMKAAFPVKNMSHPATSAGASNLLQARPDGVRTLNDGTIARNARPTRRSRFVQPRMIVHLEIRGKVA